MTLTGIITRNDGPRFWAEAAGQELACTLRGRLKKQRTLVTSLVTVGDEVELELLPDGTAAIETILPRRTELSRPGFHGYKHVIAANVDQLVIVQAALQPRFKLRLAQRFLTMAGRGGMSALVVVNKCDLADEPTIRSWVAPLTDAGVDVILTSTLDGRGLAELRGRLARRVSVLAGQSGVGKSSLLNGVFPEATARTTAVSEWSSKGRHTTTSSRLYALPDGGYLADTPGIRQLALWDDDDTSEAVEEVFPEIAAAAESCKFRDCTHSHEPQCAVKAAVAAGRISEHRYKDYLGLHGR